MNPPSENPTFVKIDEGNFYYATTSSTQYSVEDLKNEIVNLQATLDSRMQMLSDASAAGVSDASAKLDEIAAINTARTAKINL